MLVLLQHRLKLFVSRKKQQHQQQPDKEKEPMRVRINLQVSSAVSIERPTCFPFPYHTARTYATFWLVDVSNIIASDSYMHMHRHPTMETRTFARVGAKKDMGLS